MCCFIYIAYCARINDRGTANDKPDLIADRLRCDMTGPLPSLSFRHVFLNNHFTKQTSVEDTNNTSKEVADSFLHPRLKSIADVFIIYKRSTFFIIS